MDPAKGLEAMLAAGKDGPLLRFGLGKHYLDAGEPARAVEHLRAAVGQDPAYSAAWKLLGRALEAASDPGGAMHAYRSGIAAAQRRGDKQAEREMGVFLRRLERARPAGSGG
ncbi:MAG TPA: tetratricopeptide repeat protein [Usitatibacter sp.]|nr:tetratricopeptide repeat protein [Usitatibacter sp.]